MANEKYVAELLNTADDYANNVNFESVTRDLISGLSEIIRYQKVQESETSKKMADSRLKERRYDELAANHRALTKTHDELVTKIRSEVVPKIQSVSQLLSQIEKEALTQSDSASQPQIAQIRSALRDILICFTAGKA